MRSVSQFLDAAEVAIASGDEKAAKYNLATYQMARLADQYLSRARPDSLAQDMRCRELGNKLIGLMFPELDLSEERKAQMPYWL